MHDPVYAQLPLVPSEPLKRCSKCGEPKPLTEYARAKRMRDGLQPWCRTCQTAHRAIWRAAHPERDKETQHRWVEANREYVNAQVRAYKATHPNEARDSSRKSYAKHIDRRRQEQIDARAEDPETAREQERAYYAATRERRREVARVTYERMFADPERREKEWIRLNDQSHRRRLATNTDTEDLREHIAWLRTQPCSYCGRDGGEIDHIVPISAGGSHTYDNLTSACMSCNRSKNATPLLLFLVREWVCKR